MKKIILFLMFVTVPCFAAEEETPPRASLFFTPAEAHQAERLAARQAPAGEGNIRLGAVMYYGPKDWTLWLQGERWTPETQNDKIRILDVSPNDVRLSWHDDEKGEDKILSLQPNQSYQIATGKIIQTP